MTERRKRAQIKFMDGIRKEHLTEVSWWFMLTQQDCTARRDQTVEKYLIMLRM